MSKYKKSTLAGLVGSDSEDDQIAETKMTMKQQSEDATAAKKVRGRPKAAPSKVTKTKPPARRTSGRLNGKTSPEPLPQVKRGRKAAVADKTSRQKNVEKEVEQIDETADVTMEDVASGDELDAEVVAVKEVQAKATKKPAIARGRVAKAVAPESEVAEETVAPVGRKGRPGRKGKGKAQEEPAVEEQSPENIIQETQVPEVNAEMEVDIEEEEEEAEKEDSIPDVKRKESQAYNEPRRRQISISRHRAGSASDTERNDPAVRRRLGELSKKLENVEGKYDQLRGVGIKEAEKTFDRYKKASEEKTKGKKFSQSLAGTH